MLSLNGMVDAWQLNSHELELTRSRQRVHQLEEQLARERKINRRLRRSQRRHDDTQQSAAAAAVAQVDVLTSQVVIIIVIIYEMLRQKIVTHRTADQGRR